MDGTRPIVPVESGRLSMRRPPASSTPTVAQRGQRQRGPRLALVLAALPALILALAGYQQRWVTDDAFITFRVVQQVLAGHGPVFNVGERVEAYTHPLWLLLLTIWTAAGAPIEVGSVVLGLGLAVAGLVAGQAAAARLQALVHGGWGWSLPLGALVFVAVPAVWQFATSGLETGLTLAWLGLTFWLLAQLIGAGRPRWQWLATAVTLGLGPLIRPDLALFSALWLVTLLVIAHGGPSGPLRLGQVAALLLATLSLPVAYQIFRMGYFATLVPNTALAKEAGQENWTQGLTYLRDFVDTYVLNWPLLLLLGWLVIVVATVLRRRQSGVALLLLATLVAASLHAAGIIRLGGDFIHARLLIPSLFGLLLPVLTLRLPPRRQPRLMVLAWGGAIVPVLAWVVICVLWLRLDYPAGQRNHIGDEHGFYAQLADRPNPVTIEDYQASSFAQEGRRLRQRTEQLEREGQPPRLAIERGDDDPFEAQLLPERTFTLASWVAPQSRLVTGATGLGIIGYLAWPTRLPHAFR